MKRQEYWNACRKRAEEFLKSRGIDFPSCGYNVGLGWMDIVDKALDDMIAAGWDKKLGQVKQKFCGLRIYYDNRHPSPLVEKKIDDIISHAESLCSVTCEYCGKPREDAGEGFGMAYCNACKIEWTKIS